MRHLTDPLGLLETDDRLRLAFGDTAVTAAMRGGRMRTSLDSVGTAAFDLDPQRLGVDLPDYLAPLAIHGGARRQQRQIFYGHVRRADMGDDGIVQVRAADASSLTETTTGGLQTHGVMPQEVVYVVARAAGLEPSQLVIDGLEDLPLETFEILVPLEGVYVSARTTLGDVALLPGAPVCERLLEEALTDRRLQDVSCYAAVLETDRLCFAAEQRALRSIDVTLSWICARMRYGLALLPDGSAQSFDREHARALPSRRDVVAVRGLLSGRRYSRSPSPQARASALNVDQADPLLGSVALTELSTTDRLALSAARRAASINDPLERIQALWDAIEFVVAGVRAPKPVSKEQIKSLKRASRDLDEPLRRRLHQAIDNLQQTPLMSRLRFLIESRNLPCSEGEMQLLSEMRAVRNRVAHGRSGEPPAPEQLDYATALVCRLIVSKLVHAAGSFGVVVGDVDHEAPA